MRILLCLRRVPLIFFLAMFQTLARASHLALYNILLFLWLTHHHARLTITQAFLIAGARRVTVETARGSISDTITQGIAGLHTRSAKHPTYILKLPGVTLFSRAFSYKALVSLRHGYKISLSADTGFVRTPDGDTITLEVRNGLYHFPAPSAESVALPVSTRASARNGAPTLRSALPPPSELPVRSEHASEISLAAPPTAHSSVMPLPAALTDVTNVHAGPSDSVYAVKPLIFPPSAASEGEPVHVDVIRISHPSEGDPVHVDSVSSPHSAPSMPVIMEEEEDLSPQLILNLNKWDAIHNSYGHPQHNSMLKIAAAMLEDDPHRPLLRTLSKWMHYHGPCADCVTAAIKCPHNRRTHPDVPRRPDIHNGQGLHIDC
jgi:hypothetical protein